MLGLFSALTSLFCYLFSLFFYPFFRLLLFFSSVCVCRCFRFSLNFSLIIITDFFYYFLSGGYLGTLSLFPTRLPLFVALSACVRGVSSFVVVWFRVLSRSLSLADKGVVQRWWLRWWRFPASLPRVAIVTDVTWWLLQSDRQGLLRWWFFSGFGVIVVGCVVFLLDWTIFSVENCYFLSSGLDFIVEHSFLLISFWKYITLGVLKFTGFPHFPFQPVQFLSTIGEAGEKYTRGRTNKNTANALLRKALPAALAMHVAFSTHFSRIRTHLRNWHRTKLTTHGLLRW